MLRRGGQVHVQPVAAKGRRARIHRSQRLAQDQFLFFSLQPLRQLARRESRFGFRESAELSQREKLARTNREPHGLDFLYPRTDPTFTPPRHPLFSDAEGLFSVLGSHVVLRARLTLRSPPIRPYSPRALRAARRSWLADGLQRKNHIDGLAGRVRACVRPPGAKELAISSFCSNE